jgi:hypothetical protein
MVEFVDVVCNARLGYIFGSALDQACWDWSVSLMVI